MHTTRIAIIGKGIAGLTLSQLLARQGIDHVVLARRDARRAVALAETLPPSALVLLQQLGLRALFEASAIGRTYGYHSLWGTDRIVDTNFFFHRPFNYGLKLDKAALLQALEANVADHVRYFDRKFAVAAHPDGRAGWQLHFSDGHRLQTLQAAVVIDATGRKRALLKQLGVPAQQDDPQLAFSCHIPFVHHPQLKHSVFTEAFPGGWGIASRLNPDTQILTLFTVAQQSLRDFARWPAALSRTRVLRTLLPPPSQPHAPKITGHEAGSSRATHIAGPGWLALGDAAIAFDPLSSHGITNAVYTARAAAEALRGGGATFQGYAALLGRVYAAYRQTRTRLHAQISAAPAR